MILWRLLFWALRGLAACRLCWLRLAAAWRRRSRQLARIWPPQPLP